MPDFTADDITVEDIVTVLWEIALRACIDFLKAEAGYEMDIIFAVIDDENYAMGCADGESRNKALNRPM